MKGNKVNEGGVMNEKLTEEVIVRAMNGDRSAYDIIYRCCEGKIRSYIISHINDKSQADDALQNTFISVYKNISRLKSPDSFKKWIFTIAYNECMTVNKAVSRQQQRSFSLNADYDEGDDDGDGTREFVDDSIELPEEFVTNMELQNLLIDALNDLPQKQRDCVVLYYYQQLPLAEIGERLDMNENTVKTHKSKALASLRRKLEKYRKDYNFAMVPMSAMFKGLKNIGKVKSKFIALSGAAVGHSVSAGAIVGVTITAAVIGAGVLTFGFSNKAPKLGDRQFPESDAIERRVETPQTSSYDDTDDSDSAAESAPDTPEQSFGVSDDTSADDSAPGVPDNISADSSSYTAYNENESGQPQYTADSSLEAYMSDNRSGGNGGTGSEGGSKTVLLTDSQTDSKSDKIDSKPDKTESKSDKTESEPDKLEPMTVEKMKNMTFGEYLNAEDGQYEWVKLPFGNPDQYGIRNLAYPDFVFQTIGQWEKAGIDADDSSVFRKDNIITVPKEEYINDEYELSNYEKYKNDEDYKYYNYSLEEYKMERGKEYDSLLNSYDGYFDYSLGSKVDFLYCEKGVDIGNGITVGMTFNEIKSIVGDDLEFEPVGGNALQSSGPVAEGTINGVTFEIAFELTDEETEIYSNALAAKIEETAGTEAPLNVSISGFNPKSSAAVLYLLLSIQ